MTQETVVLHPRSTSFEQSWVFQLRPHQSSRVGQLKFDFSGKPVLKMSFVTLAELKSSHGEVVLSASNILVAQTMDVFEQSLKVALSSERLSQAEAERARELVNTIRAKSSDILQPFARYLWQSRWKSEGGMEKSLTWAHGPFLPKHLARFKKQEEVSRVLIHELSGEEYFLQKSMNDLYGAWFWPNVVGLCAAVLSRAAMESVIGPRSLEPVLKPLEALLFEDGNLPLGITRERELLILTA